MADRVPRFDRRFVDAVEPFSAIGGGSLGGKAAGLLEAREQLATGFDRQSFPDFHVDIPTLTVLATDLFDRFLEQNELVDLVTSNASNQQIAHAFRHASLPPDVVGDLRALVTQVRTPLAVRSSSLLEDALARPFAGVYGTKMIPNNQHDPDARFRGLVEAIKFVYASTFFERARAYVAAAHGSQTRDRMAVIVQEVVGCRHRDRFYPEISGVARSRNFYPRDGATPADGIVLLALGLGKTIVEGGAVWAYSPARPRATPPYASVQDLLNHGQTTFWAVNMGRPPAYDPMAEAEHLVHADLAAAEEDGTLRYVGSTYDARADRLVPGVGVHGARAVTFAPLLVLEERPLAQLVRTLLDLFGAALGGPVEIEFAVTFPPDGAPARVGFLQVRPMATSDQTVDVAAADLDDEAALVASQTVLGNGVNDAIQDVVYVRPDRFDPARTRGIAAEVARLNRNLVARGQPYLLIGFGRWGSADSWLGIPVDWSDISAARAIVEAARPGFAVEASQGSHFFHNVSSFAVPYFSVDAERGDRLDWAWLDAQPVAAETEHVRHVRLAAPLRLLVDGRSGRGVVRRP